MTDAVNVLDDAIDQTVDLTDEDVGTVEPAMSDIYRNPWDRRDAESDYHWQMFKNYRNGGITRSLKATARWSMKQTWADPRVGSDKNGNSLRAKEERTRAMSATHDWPTRVFEFDKEQERQYQLARSESIREMAERHGTIIQDAIKGLMVPIEALNHAIEDDPLFVQELSKTDKKKLIDLANRASRTIPSLMSAERLARGMPTEIVGGVVEHQVIHSIERDRIGEVLEVLGQAGFVPNTLTAGEPGAVVDAEVVDVYSVPAESDERPAESGDQS